MSISRPRDVIRIESLDVGCVIGLYAHERDIAQRIVLDVELAVDLDRAAKSGRLEDTIDYELVVAQLVFALKVSRFTLLESAGDTLCKLLLLPPVEGEGRCQVAAVTVQLKKRAALANRATPVLRMTRRAEDYQFDTERKDFGAVDIVHESEQVGLYRLRISPGRSIPLHVHNQMQESELVLSRGLLCQGQPASRGSVRRWAYDVPHDYQNPSPLTQALLCADRPHFIDSDEILVDRDVEPAVPCSVWEID